MLFFSFSFCIWRNHRSAYGLTANWFNIVQIGRYYSVPAGRRCVSFSSLLQSHALPNCENTTQSERQTRLRDTPDPSSSRRLSSLPRDHRPPSRDARQSRAGFHPSCTQIRVGGSQTGTQGPQPIFFTLTVPEPLLIRSAIHFSPVDPCRTSPRPWIWLASCLRTARRHRLQWETHPHRPRGRMCKPMSTKEVGSGSGVRPIGIAQLPSNKPGSQTPEARHGHRAI